MNRFSRPFRICLLTLLAIGFGSERPDAAPVPRPSPSLAQVAPPPAPPSLRRPASEDDGRAADPFRQSSLAVALKLYSIGDPTDEEQLYLEFINRARANPAAAAARYQETQDPKVLGGYEFFSVDLNRMAAQIAALRPTPPLSMNSRLTAAARIHSQDMLVGQYQGHDGTDGSTIPSRITTQGYDWTFVGENVFANAKSVWHGHVAFDVDWGGSAATGGMQDPPGHRLTIHEPDYLEVGIGVVNGRNGTSGPQVVTQDFGRPRTLTPFVTGVAFYDFNANLFYDLGEGIPGITVKVTGSPYYAVTASSGGYSVPVSADGSYTVAFSISGWPDVSRVVNVSNKSSVKLDWIVPYSPPAVTGPDTPASNRPNLYQFTPVAGATGYQWQSARRVRFAATEGAEAGLTRVTVQASSGYDVLDPTVKASGQAAFHLAHPQPEDQLLTLNRLFRPRSTSQLLFSSRLGYAGPAQTALAEISADGGATWTDLWQQVGRGDQGQTSFSSQQVSLGAYAGEEILLRFRYAFSQGIYYSQTARGVGFYLDDIQLTETEELLEEQISTASTSLSFAFEPSQTADYSLRVRALLAQRLWPWGPAKLVTSQIGETPPPSLTITAIRRLPPSQVRITFQASNPPGARLELQVAASVTGPWTTDAAARIDLLEPERLFQATTATSGAAPLFFRVVAR